MIGSAVRCGWRAHVSYGVVAEHHQRGHAQTIFEREPWRLTPHFALYLLSIGPATVKELAITAGCGWNWMSFVLAELATSGCVVAVRPRGGRAWKCWRPGRIWHITEEGLLALEGCA